MPIEQAYDTAVIGAGVFGSWIANTLAHRGERVLLVDAYGGGNSRSSSGDESRILRHGYGANEIYTRMAVRSLALWRAFCERTGEQLFIPSGVLWLEPAGAGGFAKTAEVLALHGVPFAELEGASISARWPHLRVPEQTHGLFEPTAGVLMARRSVQAVVEDATRAGARYELDSVAFDDGKLFRRGGGTVRAGRAIFACGPWLGQVFPDVAGPRLFLTRQEVVYFGTPPGDSRFDASRTPAWLHPGGFYGIPNLDLRGIKAAWDGHGGPIDPDSEDRRVDQDSIERLRSHLGSLFPDLASAPAVESRVCQYENTSNGDFLIDRHPRHENVWLVGGGSGHGFKHGPAVGEYVAAVINGERPPEPRFALSTKLKVQHRMIY